MSSVIISGDTSGAITLSAPAVAGTNTITLPAATGTVVLTGTTPTLNGITFPATQVPSADANTLDDYEEGTWTAGWANNNGNSSISTQTCTYTKIGRVVTLMININITLGTSTVWGNLTGIPFTPSSGNFTSYFREWYTTGDSMVLYGSAGSTTLQITNYDNNVAVSGTFYGIGGSITYIV
jgi:hypothetical protein